MQRVGEIPGQRSTFQQGMFLHRHLSLKKQLGLLLLVQALFGLMVQTYYGYSLGKLLTQRQHEFHQINRQEFMDVIEGKIARIRYIEDTLSLNSMHQEYVDEKDPLRRAQLKATIEKNYVEICTLNRDVHDIKLLSPEQHELAEVSADTDFILQRMMDENTIGKKGIVTPFYRDNTVNIYGGKTIFFASITPLYSTQTYTGEAIAYLAIIMVMDNINTYTSPSTVPQGTAFTITDSFGRVGSSTDRSLINTIIQSNEAFPQKTLVTQTLVPEWGWTIHASNSLSYINNDVWPVLFGGFLVFLLAFIMMTALSIILFNSFSGPIRHLAAEIREIRDDNATLEIQQNEVDVISWEINQMLFKLKKSNEELIAKQKALLISQAEKDKAQLAALQSQINPHFLYNTLESIRMMALCEEGRSVSTAIKRMANMFRYATQNASREVSLREELRNLEDYVELLRIRYEEKIHVEFHRDEDVLEAPIMKFSLQPLLENAFEHGLKRGLGTIQIQAQTNEQGIGISITDDGEGIPPEHLAYLLTTLEDDWEPHPREQGGIGLANVHHRIRRHFGAPYGLTLESKYHAGTRVSLLIPRNAL